MITGRTSGKPTGASGFAQYERTCGALNWASNDYPWLTVIAGGLGSGAGTCFAIGGHPIRFCRGDEEEIAVRMTQQPCFPELLQQQTLFGSAQDRWLRIVIENGPEGRPSDIRLMEIDADGAPIRSYLIRGGGHDHHRHAVHPAVRAPGSDSAGRR